MRKHAHRQKTSYILIILVVIFVCFTMNYLSYQAEYRSFSASDFSGDWFADGSNFNLNAISTRDFGGSVVLTKTLPEEIRYNDALCFMSTNSFFDIYIGEDRVYTYSQPVNFTGYGYGSAYHSVNLSPEQAGKTIRIEMSGPAHSNISGRIRMLSIESSQEYFARLARGKLMSYIISVGIALIGILILLFRLIAPKTGNAINTIALGITAVISGLWTALDTGFTRLVMNSIISSRSLTYLCMHICFLPLVLFIYSITKGQKKVLKWAACVISAVYYAVILIARFGFGRDMASNAMIKCFFVYGLLMLALLILMMYDDYKHFTKNGFKRSSGFFLLGTVTAVVCIVADCIIYACGVRSISGYASFSRVGCFVFFLNTGIEVVRIWAKEYASLKESGFEDALTGVGNRRACADFEEGNKDRYPYGFIMCDINALKRENDDKGHASGDRLIRTVAGKLVNAFGAQYVFRVGGDEFIAYSFEETEDRFLEKLEQIRTQLSEKDASASVGGVFVSDGTRDQNEVKTAAEKLMYAEKERYYTTHNDRRR